MLQPTLHSPRGHLREQLDIKVGLVFKGLVTMLNVCLIFSNKLLSFWIHLFGSCNQIFFHELKYISSLLSWLANRCLQTHSQRGA